MHPLKKKILLYLYDKEKATAREIGDAIGTDAPIHRWMNDIQRQKFVERAGSSRPIQWKLRKHVYGYIRHKGWR